MNRANRLSGLFKIAAFVCFLAITGYAIYKGLSVTGTVRYLDGRILFIAAHCLGQGASPYDLGCFSPMWLHHFGSERWDTMFFPYPPTMLPIIYSLSFFEWETGRKVLDTANIVALGSIFGALAIWIKGASADERSWLVWAGLALAALCGSISGVLTIGQTSLLATAGVFTAALLAHKQAHPLLFGLAVLVASIKPQLTLVPVLAIMLYSSRRQFSVAVITMICALAGLILLFGWQMMLQFAGTLTAYGKFSSNQGPQLVGASFLAASMGFSLPLFVALIFAVVTTAFYLWMPWRKSHGWAELKHALSSQRLDAETTSGIILCSSFWMPLHQYDLVIYMLPLALLVLQGRHSILLLLPCLLLVARPGAVVAIFGHSTQAPLIQSLAMLCAAAGAVYLAAARKPQSQVFASPDLVR